MDKKVSAGIFTFLLVLSFPLGVKAIAILYVDPSTTVTSVDDTFSVNITISGVSDLAGWEFKLYYLSAKLNGTNIVEGPFLKKGGPTFFGTINFTDDYNSTHGLAWVTCALLGGSPGVNGNGTLAIVTFKAKQFGTSNLSLADTLLSDSQPISHTTLNGVVHILFHDVAITSLALSKTVVGQGFTAKIYVNVLNQGNFTETFNVTASANTTYIDNYVNITLLSGNSTTVTLTWNTTGFAKGNYTISAYATPVLGETDTDDNTSFDGMIQVGVPCDVTGPTECVPDGICNMRDIAYIALKFGTTPSSPGWDPNCDVRGSTPRVPDDKVDMRDIGEACINFLNQDP